MSDAGLSMAWVESRTHRAMIHPEICVRRKPTGRRKRGPGAEACQLGNLGRGREPKKTPNLDPTAYLATGPNISPAAWKVLSLLSRAPFRKQVAIVPIVRPETPSK